MLTVGFVDSSGSHKKSKVNLLKEFASSTKSKTSSESKLVSLQPLPALSDMKGGDRGDDGLLSEVIGIVGGNPWVILDSGGGLRNHGMG